MENEIFYEEIELQSPANDFAHAIAITIGFQLYFLKIKRMSNDWKQVIS